MSVCNNIKKCRLLKKMTQKQVSELLDINIRTYQKYESGDISPSINTLNKIAKALVINVDILIHGTDNFVTCEDFFVFICNLYPFKYYTFHERNKLINKIVNENYNVYEIQDLLLGLSRNKKLYESLSNAIGLTTEQNYNWILSIVLFAFLQDQGMLNDDNCHLVRSAIIENILITQTIDNLLDNGLSDKNKNIFKEYLAKQVNVNSNKYISKNNTDDSSISDFIDSIDNQFIKDELKSKISKINNLIPILKEYGIIFNILKENSKILVRLNINSEISYQELPLDDFLNFIDKILWGIEREVDYIKRLYEQNDENKKQY
ncbi:helix-turn-helix transcriptional regulator [Romboutsia sp. MSSM.1001216sp_RTP31141st1_G3_RTP31141_220114]|uniref:helix-turn-helix domain-containing protein n=1 Tax=unclassified Romboutsia TaxID=2626894 RepID=UPI0031B63E38